MILIVSATQREVAPLLSEEKISVGISTPLYTGNRDDIRLLITGIGSVPTTFHLQAELAKGDYTAVINVGIAGSYSPALGIGDVVVVAQDTFGDYGIDDNGHFRTLFQHRLDEPNRYPYKAGLIPWRHDSLFPMTNQLPRVKGITLSTASGSEGVIGRVEKQFAPDIETMEGAAVFYTCSMMNIPFLCLRGISNRVEPRNVANWVIPSAIENVCQEAKRVISLLP